MIGLRPETDVIVSVKDLKEQTPKHIQSFFRGRDPVLCVILAHDKEMGLFCSRMSFPNVDKFQVFLISFDIGLPQPNSRFPRKCLFLSCLVYSCVISTYFYLVLL